MKKRIFFSTSFAFALCFLLLPTDSFSQAYKFGAGWRYGSSVHGASIKIAPKQGLAFEGIVGFFPSGTTTTLLVQGYRPLARRTLQIYGGMGAHAKFNYNQETPVEFLSKNLPTGFSTNLPFGVGIDAIVGIELKIPRIPLAIYGEAKPFAEATPWGDLHVGIDPAIGARIVLGKFEGCSPNKRRNYNRRSKQGKCGKWGCG